MIEKDRIDIKSRLRNYEYDKMDRKSIEYKKSHIEIDRFNPYMHGGMFNIPPRLSSYL